MSASSLATKHSVLQERFPHPSPLPLRWERGLGIAILLALLGLWQLGVQLSGIPPLVLPGPIRVAQDLVRATASGILWPHAGVTLVEVFGGFAVGSALGFGLGAAAASSRRTERLISPYVVASQALPKLALAPLLVVWLGFGLTSKIVVAALVSFFPLFENTVLGLRSAEPAQSELFRSLRATKSQTFRKLLLPASLPYVATGLRVALILSLVGAVVAEFVGSNRGLGALLVSAQGVLNTPLMFAVIVVLTLIGIVLYWLASGLERIVLRWRFGE
ncbi:MAG TPA: ABC transporter permease [Chloroflexota bacterium]